MTPAPRPADWGVLLVTDRHTCAPRGLVETVEAALGGGIRAVQLREKDLTARELLELARALRAATRRHGAALLVNDRADVALAAGADGVHLPASSFPPAAARQLLGARAIIGVSTHRPAEVRAAAAAGADYAVFGPVFATPSKAAFGPPAGPEALAEACRVAPIPVFAIGGVGETRAAALVRAGAAGVAVIRAILAAADPQRAAAALLAAVRAAARSGG